MTTLLNVLSPLSTTAYPTVSFFSSVTSMRSFLTIFLPRVKLAVGVLEVVDGQVDVLLGCGEVGVAEHLLNMTDTGPVFYEFCAHV